VGYLALFLVLTGGTAQALDGSNTVFSDDIVNREVTVSDIGPNAITTTKIENRQVATGDLAIGAVEANQIAPNAVNGSRVADASLDGADVAVNSLTGADIDEGTVFLGGDLNGALSSASLGLGAVVGSNVASDTLGGSQIDESSLFGVDAEVLDGRDSRAISYHVTTTHTATETIIGGVALRPVCIAQSGEDNVKLFARSTANGSWITAVAKQDSDSTATTTADDATYNLNDQIEIQTAGDGGGYLMVRKGLTGPPVMVMFSYNEGDASCDVMAVAFGGP
jgi:hypothetical protein